MTLGVESSAPRHIMAALVGGAGSGMTTLVEAVLHRAGVIARPGTIAAGTTVGDNLPEEVSRGTTLTPSLTFLEWDDDDGAGHFTMTLSDTPGHPDFIGGVDAVLSAADLAVVVVSAVAGVTAGTRAAWEAVDAAGLPRIVMVTCTDRPQADFHRVLAELRDTFGPHLWPIELPIGTQEQFRAVADVLGRRALALGPDGHQVAEPLPDDVAALGESMHDEVTEEIVSHDDTLLEAYLDGTEPSFDVLQDRLAEQTAAGDAVPVILASGVTETGVDRFVDVLCRLVPALTSRAATIRVADTDVTVARDPGGEPLVHVFDVVADQFVGQIAMLKVLSGTIHPGDRLRNADTGVEERLGTLFRLCGAQRIPCDTLRAGEVGGVAKLTGSPAHSLLWTRSKGRAVPRALPDRPAVYAVTLEPVTQSDAEKLSAALARASAEDHTLEVEFVGGAAVVRGLGDTHIDVLVDRLARIFGVQVTVREAPVAYRETVAATVRAEGRLKKQSGGHGQFAVVHVVVSPLPPGGGFEFVSSVVGGAVPRQYVPAVEKGVRDTLERGGPHGYPVVDVRVELVDGKAHSVDSSDMAFRTAGSMAVQEALTKAGTVVLEPVSAVTVTVPMAYQGAVMTDLAGRRGRVHDTQMTQAGDCVVIATVPDVELHRYALDLRSLTHGYGAVTLAPDHHEPAGTPTRA